MSESVLQLVGQIAVAIILAVQGVLVAWITVSLGRVRRDAAATREQVENNHKNPDGTPINLREEADERHGENRGLLFQILGSVNWLVSMALSNAGRITELEEHTGQPPQTRRERRLASDPPPRLISDVPETLRKDQ